MGKTVDLTGQKFGRLIAIKRIPMEDDGKSKFAWWECQCECGNKASVRASLLRNGGTKSCGCLNKETRKYYMDLTGKRYGDLVVLRKINDESPFVWECICECGNKVTIRGDDLKQRKTRSCGCLKHKLYLKDLTGKRFGKLTVIRKTSMRAKNKNIIWECRCDCGNIKLVEGALLKTLHTKSCGCLQKESTSLEYGVAAFNHVYSSYKKRAREKKLMFSLGEEEFKDIILKSCVYCGSILDSECKGNGNGSFVYTGIDRIDSNKGYTLDNIVPCCKICNRAKNTMPQEDFIAWAKRIANHWKPE